MLIPLCPACRYPNPAQSTRCVACGTALPASALWLDELGQPATTAPPAAAPAAPDAQTTTPITLRNLPEAPLPGRARPLPPPPAPPRERVDGLIVSDLEPQELAELAAKRAAKRAAVRRARSRALAASEPDGVPEVLICDGDNLARGRLRDLLVAFGFGVHAVAGVVQASALLTQRPFVAAFFDVALDDANDDAGIALCQQARGLAAMLRVLTSAPLSPVQRVRASLAGFDEVLAKPVSRGNVARVLDARGIVLPSDARRGGTER